MKSDDEVGSGSLKVKDLKSFNQVVNVPMLYKKKNIGTCAIRVRFEAKQQPNVF